MTYSFIITVSGINPFADDLEAIFHGVGCDDATIAVQGGRIRLYFDRAADSLEIAVASAVAEIRSLDAIIVDIFTDDPDR